MRKFISLETLIDTLNNEIGGGEFHTLTFVSMPKMRKAYESEPIYKINKVQIRTKLDYEHTERYKQYVAEHPYMSERAEDSTYIVGKAIKHNNKTNNDLFMVIPKYETWESRYEDENGNEVSAEQVAEMTCKKSKTDTPPYVMTANARKIISLV